MRSGRERYVRLHWKRGRGVTSSTGDLGEDGDEGLENSPLVGEGRGCLEGLSQRRQEKPQKRERELTVMHIMGKWGSSVRKKSDLSTAFQFNHGEEENCPLSTAGKKKSCGIGITSGPTEAIRVRKARRRGGGKKLKRPVIDLERGE